MRCLFSALAWLTLVPAAQAQGAAPIATKYYAISGSTGQELYRSIEQRGPNGGGHIAQTKPKLIWNRLFDERGGDCYLVHARPALSFTQLYPKPSNALSPDMKRRWDKLVVSLRDHEKIHVDMFVEMVRSTETSLAGMFEPKDRTCAKVKKSVQARINENYEAYRVRSRAFDKQEIGFGGKMFMALEDLVNER